MFRSLTILGLIGAAVGLFFGAKGLVTAKHASDSVNRKGGDAKSQFHADRLTKSLDKVRAEVGADGQLLQLNIYPGYIQADASTGSEDKGRSFRIQEDGRVDELPVTLTGPGMLKDNVFPHRQGRHEGRREARRPGRRQGAPRARRRLAHRRDDPAGLRPAGHRVYLSNQRFWRAALDGKGLSSPDQQARARRSPTPEDARRAWTNSARRTQAAPQTKAAPKINLAACLTAAGTDAAKITACTK